MRDKAKFITYLKKAGAEILEPTNYYEVVRFRTENGVSVVYQNKRGGLSFTGESQEAYDMMKKSRPWTSTSAQFKEKKRLLAEILERDGVACFYCGEDTIEETQTLEHLLSFSDGGNNHPSNLCIACRDCNSAVGNMPIVEKIAYRDTLKQENE